MMKFQRQRRTRFSLVQNLHGSIIQASVIKIIFLRSCPYIGTKTIAETDGDGTPHCIAKLANAYKVSGNDFYMQDGKAVLPLGTLTAEETKAPDGYLLYGAYTQAGDKSEQIKGLYLMQITILFDYVKIRFPMMNIQHIIKDILKLNINYMLHGDYGHSGYSRT